MSASNCHPDRPQLAHGQCESCYRKARYHARRAQGMPAWAARGRSIAGWADRYPANKRWRKRHPEKALAQSRRQAAGFKEKYGGIPSKQFHCRVKWLEARSAKNAASNSNSAGTGAHYAGN